MRALYLASFATLLCSPAFAQGYTAEYFDDITVSGSPDWVRTDATIDFDWGASPPVPGFGADGFAVRWTGTVVPSFSETYAISTIADDGVRLWIDGALVIDDWRDRSATRDTVTAALTAGQAYAVRMEYYENAYDAVARLVWSSVSQPEVPIPTAGPADAGVVVDAGVGDGGAPSVFTAQYFATTSLSGPVVATRQTTTIDHDWGSGAPAGGVPVDGFSVRWTGAFVPATSQTYTLSTISDDGVRLWIDGALVVDHWTDHGATRDSVAMPLVAGRTYTLRMEHYDSGYDAVARLLWSSASVTERPIAAGVGAAPDAGILDSGVVPDSGVPPDSGVVPDSGAMPDSGVVPDSGVMPDAGFVDAGVPPDSGVSIDAGFGAFDASYFANLSLSGAPLVSRGEATIDHDWGLGAPAAGLPADGFSARWVGVVVPPGSGTYTLATLSDDGVRLWIDGVLVIDNWTDHGTTRDSVSVTLTGGQAYTFRMEHYDSGYDAVARLLWSSASLPEQPVWAAGGAPSDGGVGSDAGGADAGVPPDGGVSGGPPSSRHRMRPIGTTAANNGYWEYVPPTYGDGQSYPLLVFWHGLGENGDGTPAELGLVQVHGPPHLIAADQWPNSRPFVVLSPQHSGGGCPSASEIHAFLQHALNTYDIDTNRVYLTGLSCGAFGVWSYLGTYLDTQGVAAAVPIAGSGVGAWNARGCNLGRVAIWGFHGDADSVVHVGGTTTPMNNLVACPSPPRRDARLTVYPGVGHESWIPTYDGSAGHDIYGWMLANPR